MKLKELAEKALGLPEEPGVYLMKDAEGNIIYVGKAINLKRRVYSYFSASEKHTPKTTALVSHIRDFDVIVVATELEALLLENNLIKENLPKYNILLKDDKGFPFIKLTPGEFAQLKLARRTDGGGEYFGPYGSRSANFIIEAANRAFMLPTCKQPAPRPGRRACLNHRIKRCMGPCAGHVTAQQYAAVIDEVREFLKGDIDRVEEDTRARMETASEALDFERAAVLRDRLKAIGAILEKQRVAGDGKTGGDYIAVHSAGEMCALYLLKVEKGLLVGKHSHVVRRERIDSESAFANEYMKLYYGENPRMIPKRVVCAPVPDERVVLGEYLTKLRGGRVQVITPARTQDKQLIELALRNAREELILTEGKTRAGERSLFALAELLGLAQLESVEIYDISHTAGSDVVCGMAVYGGAGFIKDRYKKFRISAAAGDDCACLYEAALRRFKRYKDGDTAFAPLPSAIFADGALPQLRAIERAAADTGVTVPVYALKKDSRHHTKALIFPDGREVLLFRHPEVFALCGRMQEEAHRFAIEYHSSAARRRTIESMFTSVEGVGKKRAAEILQHFKTLKAVKAASAEELAQVRGVSPALAQRIHDFLQHHFG